MVTVVTTGVPRTPFSGAPSPETPPVASLPTASARSRERDGRAARIPDNFEPSPELVAWAREKAPTTGRADHEAFVDYWRGVPGAKGRKLDWAATWRNWMRKEHERRSANGARASPQRQREHNGLMLNDRTIADLERRSRLAALDLQAQTAIGGPL
jgi:hypothetical protein